MKIEYYNQYGGTFGSASFLGEDQLLVADASTVNDVWHDRQLIGVAPPGTVEARLVLQFIQPNNQAGAVHIDSVAFAVSDAAFCLATLMWTASSMRPTTLSGARTKAQSNALPNDDGLGTPIGLAHYNLWRSNFGATSGGGNAMDALGVPEPGGLPLAIGGLLGMMAFHARAAYYQYPPSSHSVPTGAGASV